MTTPTRPDTITRPGPIARFLLGCCGANWMHIKEKAELNWYCSLGMSVIVTSIISGISAVLLATTGYSNLPLALVIAIGVVWTIVVFNVDRLIVSRPLTSSRWRSKFSLFFVRFLLAAGIAILMAEGVELTLFDDEISAQVDRDNNAAAVRQQNEYNQARLDAKASAEQRYKEQIEYPNTAVDRLTASVDAATKQVEDANRVLKCESNPAPDCETGTGIPGLGAEGQEASAAVARANEALQRAVAARQDYTVILKPSGFTADQLQACGQGPTSTDLTQQAIDTCQAQILVSEQVNAVPVPSEADTSQNGLLRRIVALSSLASGEHGTTIWAVRILLFIVLASIDLVPLTAKFVGGTTGHDARVRKDSIDANNELAEKINDSVHAVPHFLEKQRGWKKPAADQRRAFFTDVFEKQADDIRGRWQSPTNARDDVLDEPETLVDPDSEPTNGVGPGYVLRTTDGDKFQLVEPLPDARTRWYDLWLCTRKDREDEDQTTREEYFVAKIGKIDPAFAPAKQPALKGLERDVLARLIPLGRHHVVDIVSGQDVQLDDDSERPFIVMRHYPLGDMKKYVEDRWGNEVPILPLLELIHQTLEALLVTHRAGFLHLDIKPANVLVDLINGEPHAVLTDFGIAGATRAFDQAGFTDMDSTFTGTYNYAAIEQILPGRGLGHQTALCDLWSVGAMVYRLISGAYPRDFAESRWVDMPLLDNGKVDRRSDEYRRWLEKTRPDAPRLDVITPGVPTPLADLVERWLSNNPLDRVDRTALTLAEGESLSDPGALLENRGDEAVMSDALARLGSTVRGIR
ncbi:DUF4407 domain-containing protein [Rhodococcus sp. 14-2483-1-1]|uniref:non-specific serine/threonine protein kinase n=2 Tax=Rhodococcoides fascians TaxID=1828 RepID=G8JZ41_RHOFA|nr:MULTISPECIES: DUF4407 domain-containing protein [Rhodococcus]AET25312.1 Ser/Thr protein kinase [Rhodococcus fascians D188]AMY56336.1 Serine/threonine-protein kinase PknL [Rhodococcus fascians D188]OZC47818.1 DUF4407 domain-containing protein [Rhodococcus sp. 06-621-2]OZC64184.1 DUF4407 domain-containing protein [Rhodococcus sp. 06-462-5]OZC72878.1 DUF4407 domain-containing protein [Rhodococcus sp. 06-469-3-2]